MEGVFTGPLHTLVTVIYTKTTQDPPKMDTVPSVMMVHSYNSTE